MKSILTIFNHKVVKRAKSITLSSLLFTLCVSSCMNFEPEDTLSDATVWTSANNFQLFANQFYGWERDFASSTDYRNGLSDGVHSDLRSDLLCASSENAYNMGKNGVPNSDGNYTSIYKSIYYTNLLLQNALVYKNQDEIATPKGEAHFFRAYMNFELLQIYGDAIIMSEPIDMDNEKMTAERNPRSEVADTIIYDLKKAIELLPDKPAEDGRVGKMAARAFLSRVALYEGTWQKYHNNGGVNNDRVKKLLELARDNAQTVIDEGGYSIFKNDQLVNSTVSSNNQSYRYLFILENEACNPAGLTKADNTEFILSKRHRSGDALGMNITGAMLNNAQYVTRKMAQMYLCTNGLPIYYGSTNKQNELYKGDAKMTSEFTNRDLRMDNCMLWNGEHYWDNKSHPRSSFTETDDATGKFNTANVCKNSGYATQKFGVETACTDGYEYIDYPVIRLGEILLNYAEAVYELEGSITNNELDYSINKLRSRAGVAKLTNALVDDNELDMRTEIRRERTVELFLEGFRIDDLKRWAIAVDEMNTDRLGVHYKDTEFATKWTNLGRSTNADGCIIMYSGAEWTDRNYLYPLPNDQREYNPNLGQNPGWE